MLKLPVKQLKYSMYAGLSVFFLFNLSPHSLIKADVTQNGTFEQRETTAIETVGPLTWEADTQPAKSKDSKDVEHIVVKRNLQFIYRNSDVNEKKTAMLPDASAIVQEHFPDGDSKSVDCRIVAKKMIFSLIKNRVESWCTEGTVADAETGECQNSGSSSDGESRIYRSRASDRDTAFVASMFNSVIIKQAGEEEYPYMACENLELKHGEGEDAKIENAWCGKLTIAFKPRVAQSGDFEGQQAFRLNPDYCEKMSTAGVMSLKDCELMFQVNACGLRDVQKALKPDESDSNYWGLSNWLEFYLAEKKRNADYPSKKKTNAKDKDTKKDWYKDEEKAGGRSVN